VPGTEPLTKDRNRVLSRFLYPPTVSFPACYALHKPTGNDVPRQDAYHQRPEDGVVCCACFLYLLTANFKSTRCTASLAVYVPLSFSGLACYSCTETADVWSLSYSEPCIRGHRSTKCNHASERLMVPVRKPGRPLSICPHPPARPCGCAGVTAAIPRRQTCHCSPSRPSKGMETAISADVAPGSPKSLSGPGRIQKPPKPPRPPTRKQSIDVTSLERIDANHVNILPPFDARAQDQAGSNGVASTALPPASVGGEFAALPIPLMPPHPGAMGHMMYPVFPRPPMVSPSLNNEDQHDPTNGLNGSVNQHDALPASTHGAQAPPATQDAGPMLQHRRNSSKSNGTIGPKLGSCCQGPSTPTATKSPHGLGQGQAPRIQQNGNTPPLNGVAMPPHNQPPFPSYFPQPTVFTYPPHYGSYLYPLLPDIWRQAMAFMTAGSGGMSPNLVGHAPSNLNFVPDSNPQTPTMGVSHMCTCGDGCQCIGCAAHPYNDATQDYVRSAWTTMMQEGWSTGVNGMAPPVPTMGPIGEISRPTTANALTEGMSCPMPDTNQPTGSPRLNGSGAGSCCANDNRNNPSAQPTGKSSPKSPAAAQSPSDSGSLSSEDQQTLSANDFFFVTYPFSEACMGETASCPCGDDCQCLGCVVHGNAGNMTTSSGPWGTGNGAGTEAEGSVAEPSSAS